jgi:mono/diheme cytochrome c family protein
MKGSVTVIGLLVVALAGLIGAHWLILPDPSQRNYEFLPNMDESYARDAQSPPPVLDDGTALDLRPPEGSVARGYMPFEYPATPEGAMLAGRELKNPFAADDAEAAARGAIVYSNFCAVCHGGAGHGDGPVTRKGVPPPPSLLLENALDMADGQMFHVISTGQANMASYASQIERDDRWRAILHVRRLQAAPPAESAPTEEADIQVELETVETAESTKHQPSNADEP